MGQHDLAACSDCVYMLSNGEYEPPDPRYFPDAPKDGEELCARMEQLWPNDSWLLCLGDSDHETCTEEFCRCSCETCGSTLAGARHHVIALALEA